jgi:3-oxoacyl-[acyl-carrier protein] reductase
MPLGGNERMGRSEMTAQGRLEGKLALIAGAISYFAAKAGILGLTRALAREVVSRGIRVNVLAPGGLSRRT